MPNRALASASILSSKVSVISRTRSSVSHQKLLPNSSRYSTAAFFAGSRLTRPRIIFRKFCFATGESTLYLRRTVKGILAAGAEGSPVTAPAGDGGAPAFLHGPE